MRRDWEAGQVRVGPCPDHLLHRRRLDDPRRDRVRLTLGVERNHVLPVRAEGERQAIVRGRQADNGRELGVTHAFEEQGWELTLALELGRDSRHAKSGIYFFGDELDLI